MELTNEELKWIKALQKVLDKCPSDRIGFFTIGDCQVYLYDSDEFKNRELHHIEEDLVFIVRKHDLLADRYITFPNNVEGVCG